MDKALEYAGKIAYSSKEVLKFTYDMSVKYRDWPGVYVECGVAAGAQIIAMAAGAPNKTIYAFDSFEGIPLPSNKDNQMPGIRMLSKEEQSKLPNPGEQILESSGATSVSLDDFLDHLENAIGVGQAVGGHYFISTVLSNQAKVLVYKGWFEKSIPEFIRNRDEAESCDADFVSKYGGPNRVDKFQISILRLDGDLYNSTYVCLKYLYPKVIKGGLVIIDDWALPGCRHAVLDYFNLKDGADIFHWFDENVKLIKDENSMVAYWTK